MGTDQFFGSYRARVVDNVDPLQVGRVRMQVPEVFGETEITDWAFPKNNVIFGMVFVPAIDARIWAEFEAGDLNRPLYTAPWYAQPGGNSEVPPLVREEGDRTTQSPVGTDQGATGSGANIDEPLPAFASDYPLNRVMELIAGTIEIDDTPGEERIKVFHRSGTYVEIRRDGTIVEKSQGKKHRITVEDDVIHVNGQRIMVVEGNEEVTVKGDSTRFVEGEINETIDSPVTRTFKDDVDETVNGAKSETLDGNLVQTIAASLSQVIGQSYNRTIGQQDNKVVLQTASEQIGNSGAAADAKVETIQLGNYVIKMVSGKWQLKNAAGIVLLEFDSLAGIIKIGTNATATEPLILGAVFTAFHNANIGIFNAHVHPGVTAGGASTGPTVTAQTLMAATEVSAQGLVAP